MFENIDKKKAIMLFIGTIIAVLIIAYLLGVFSPTGYGLIWQN